MLSLCMVVKNEAPTLERAIASTPFHEAVIGVDSSSTDDSKNIAGRYTEKVFDFTWENDFSKARNSALERCTRDWIFILDGHEYVDAVPSRFPEELGELEDDVVLINVRIDVVDQEGDLKTTFYSPRLFRNRRGIRYEGSVHGCVGNLPEGRKLSTKSLVVVHHRPPDLERERAVQRDRTCVPQLLEKIRRDGEDSRTLFLLGNEYRRIADNEKAMTAYERCLEISQWPEERYQTRIFLANLHRELNETAKARDLLICAQADDWSRAEHYAMLGDLALEGGKYSEARQWFRIAAHFEDPVSPFFLDMRIYTYYPFEKLGAVYELLGRKEESRTCLRLAEQRKLKLKRRVLDASWKAKAR